MMKVSYLLGIIERRFVPSKINLQQRFNFQVMTTKTLNQTSVNASYVMNPANGQIKVVVTKKNETEAKPLPKIKFNKTYYSIDTNGGGYTGL